MHQRLQHRSNRRQRGRPRRYFSGLVVVAMLGCGTAAPAARPTTVQAAASRRAIQREAARAQAQEAQIHELEGRLSLALAEARDLRHGMGVDYPGREIVQIGAERRGHQPDLWAEDESGEDDGVDSWGEGGDRLPVEDSAVPTGSEGDHGATDAVADDRPVLRLYGRPTDGWAEVRPFEVGAADALPLAAVPQLPAMANGGDRSGGSYAPPSHRRSMPDAREPSAGQAIAGAAAGAMPGEGATAPTAQASPAPVARPDRVLIAYREALALFRDRRLGEAEAAFGRIAEQNPQHAIVEDALYWRAEALYARRAYQASLTVLETIRQRFPRGRRAADALLKQGYCHLRMGDLAAARRCFERVRTDYPGTLAARLSPTEEAT